MKTPSSDDLAIAAQWLEVYEGAEDAEACHRVARWLLEKSDAIDFRNACKAAGISVKKAKSAMAASK